MAADPLATHLSQELPHSRSLLSCVFHPDGDLLYAGSEDHTVVRFSLSGQPSASYNAGSWIRAIELLDPDTLVTGGHDGRLSWWPARGESLEPLRTVQAHDGWIRALAISPDRKLIATCGNDLKVNLWNAQDGTKVAELTGHQRHVYHVAFHPEGQQLVAGDLTAKFLQWEVATLTQTREFTMPTLHKYDEGFRADYGGPYCLKFDRTGSRLLGGGITNVTNAFAGVGNPAVAVIDWETATERVAHLSKGGIQGKAWGLVWHPEDFVIAATGGQGGGKLFFWRVDEKDEFHVMDTANSARDLALHPDGLRLATVHHDGKVRVWKMAPAA